MRARSIVIILLLICTIIPVSNLHSNDARQMKGLVVVSNTRTPHAPILISSNEDLAAWSGSGNETHPYTIEGLEIISEGPCIEIQNVSLHYLITDCSFSGTRNSSYGAVSIAVVNETNRGVISHCDIFNSSIGVYIATSNFRFEHNSIWNCSNRDAYFRGDYLKFLYNTLNSEGEYSVDWRSTYGGMMNGNTISVVPHEIRYDELRLYNNENFRMEDNIITRGRVLTNGEDLLILNNTFYIHDSDPLQVGQSDNVTINECKFYIDYTEEIIPGRLSTHGSNNTRITNCISNGILFTVSAGFNIEVSECVLSQSLMEFDDITGHLNVSYNHISDSFYGIRTVSGDYTGLTSLISHNLISNCSIGMWLAGDDSIVRNNTLFNNSLGVDARGTGNQIYYNTFLENFNSARDIDVNYWDDSVSMGNYWDRYFTVNDRWPVYLDDDAPIIVPVDPVVLPPDSNVTLYFTAVDNTPFSYSVRVDGVLFEEDSWDGDVVIIEIPSLSIGSHEVEITFTDINGNFASQVVPVTIQSPIPMIPIVIGASAIIGVVAIIFALKRRR